MNSQVQSNTARPTSVWERSTIVRFFRWLFSWRGIRRVLIVAAWMATIAALWYGEENWRGRRAWNQYQGAVKARGESLDFASYIPKPVPDDRNFAATPFLASFILHRDGSILTNDLFARADISDAKISKDRGRRHFEDLCAWQMASAALQKGPLQRGQEFETDQASLAARAAAAPAVLEGLQPDQAAFAELRAASTLEFSRYAVNYDLENPWSILLPHLARVKGVCQRLKLEACADLAASRPEPALADVQLTLALADSLKSEPFLISMLVRYACEQIAIQPVWEGLAERRWTDAQLQELQTRFLAFNFLTDSRTPLLSERACGILTADLARKKGFGFIGDEAPQGNVRFGGDSVAVLAGRLMPSGWYDWEKFNYGTLFDAQSQGTMDAAARLVSPARVSSNYNVLEPQLANMTQDFLHHRVVAALLLPGLRNVPVKTAAAQVAADQTAIACALERYRLAKGGFPDQLESLCPQFMSRLPNDVLTGQPYKYRRTADGQFILYSLGWDETDDGGVPGKTLFDQNQGDWVWQYPAL
jgi:hypothetical protein